MANRVKLASERRKLALRGALLSNRARIAELQSKNKTLQEELRQYRKKPAGTSVPPLRHVKVS